MLAYPKFCFKKQRLKVGDYTIEGYEEKVAIERKSGLLELFCNLSGRDRPRFKRFLTKLSISPIKCIIVEDHLANVDAVAKRISRINKRFTLTADTIYHWIAVITVEHDIPMLFIGKQKAQQQAIIDKLFTEVLKQL